MAFNPGNENRSGEILAGGVNNIMGQYAQDLLRSQEIEQKRRTAAGQIQGLLASSPQLSQKADPTLLAKVQSGKGNYKDTLELLGTLNTVQKQEEDALQQKLKDVQIQHIIGQNQQLSQTLQQSHAAHRNTLRNLAAMGVPSGDPEIDGSIPAVEEGLGQAETAIRKGLTDPHMIAQLRAMDDAKTRDERMRADPRAVTVGDMSGLVDATGNFHQQRTPAPREPAAQPFEVGGRQLTKVGSTILDESGEMLGRKKELDPMAAQMLYTRYQATIAQIQNEKEGTFESRETFSKRLKGLKEQANFQAQQLGYAEPFPGAAATTDQGKPATSRFKIVEQK